MNDIISDIIGYDVRSVSPSWLKSEWDIKSREQFLLRPEITCPFSVDFSVWPTLFKLGQNDTKIIAANNAIIVDPGIAAWHFKTFRLWPDLGGMLAEYKPTPDHDWGIAVGLIRLETYPPEASPIQDSWRRAILGSPINPATKQSSWKLLGYDVANSGFTSAISNCGMSEKERRELRPVWGHLLGDNGLFQTVQDAIRFNADANKRLSPDGPFYVFELFLLWNT